jgi:hypothetical protein
VPFGSPVRVIPEVTALPGTARGADLNPMTAASEPLEIPVPRHRAPEEELPAPRGGPRHRAAGDDGAHVRVAAPEERGRRGRHAAPEDDGPHSDGEDPLSWLGFRFEPA